MFLSRIIRRLENGYYRAPCGVTADVACLCDNAFAYNEPDSPICANAKLLAETVVRLIECEIGCSLMEISLCLGESEDDFAACLQSNCLGNASRVISGSLVLICARRTRGSSGKETSAQLPRRREGDRDPRSSIAVS
jgi:hypothetical protein